MRPCTCDRCGLAPADRYADGDCRLCWLWHHDADYRAWWGGVSVKTCRHLGAATGATIQCPSCTGTVALKLFACALHGTCIQARAAPGAACCATCPDRDPA